MNFQKKLLSLAVIGLALSAPVAHAAIDAGSTSTTGGNGELFFSLWHDGGTTDTMDDKSYVRDLGIGINTFTTTTNTPALLAGKTTATVGPVNFFSANALLTTFLSEIPAGANVFWNVVGNDNLGARRFVTTAAEGTTGLLPTQTVIGSRNVNTAIASFVGSTNTLSNTQNATPSSTVAVNNSNTATFANTNEYAGGVAFGTNLGSRTLFNTTGGIGAKLPFYLQFDTGVTTGNASSLSFSTAGATEAYWTLDTSGNLSYNVAAVPEADTWAMFAAGLLAVGAIARRRLAA